MGNRARSSKKCLDKAVHPHMRGEQDRITWQACSKSGSSPHAWGTERGTQAYQLRFRFIPTCVGNSSRYPVCQSMTAVHPHMRGEQANFQVTNPKRPGSSPHAWGTDSGDPAGTYITRFIPTCVGNRFSGLFQDVSRSVHPHMRGEQVFRIVSRCFKVGSSPHAWGTATSV